MSLRARLLITTVALVGVGLLAANLATYRFLSSFLLHRVDEQLVLARPFAAQALLPGEGFFGERPAELVLPPGTYAELRDRGMQCAPRPSGSISCHPRSFRRA